MRVTGLTTAVKLPSADDSSSNNVYTHSINSTTLFSTHQWPESEYEITIDASHRPASSTSPTPPPYATSAGGYPYWTSQSTAPRYPEYPSYPNTTTNYQQNPYPLPFPSSPSDSRSPVTSTRLLSPNYQATSLPHPSSPQSTSSLQHFSSSSSDRRSPASSGEGISPNYHSIPLPSHPSTPPSGSLPHAYLPGPNTSQLRYEPDPGRLGAGTMSVMVSPLRSLIIESLMANPPLGSNQGER
jgi:hypothetical protein